MTARKPPPTVEYMHACGATYLRAVCARRDALLLIEDGFTARIAVARVGIAEARGLSEKLSMEQAMEMAMLALANELLTVYLECPLEYPQGRSAAEAMDFARRAVAERFRQGRCSYCKGPALPCARRAASGRDGCA
jgi:hypothetical protein